MSSIILSAFFAFSMSWLYMKTFPFSSISILTPVSSIILLIVFPPAPITSLILSTSIFVVIILGAYFETSFLGSGIVFSITLSII